MIVTLVGRGRNPVGTRRTAEGAWAGRAGLIYRTPGRDRAAVEEKSE